MPSDTQKTNNRRLAKSRKMGRARKRKLEKHGTTPSFPLIPEGYTPPEASNETAQK